MTLPACKRELARFSCPRRRTTATGCRRAAARHGTGATGCRMAVVRYRAVSAGRRAAACVTSLTCRTARRCGLPLPREAPCKKPSPRCTRTRAVHPVATENRTPCAARTVGRPQNKRHARRNPTFCAHDGAPAGRNTQRTETSGYTTHLLVHAEPRYVHRRLRNGRSPRSQHAQGGTAAPAPKPRRAPSHEREAPYRAPGHRNPASSARACRGRAASTRHAPARAPHACRARQCDRVRAR